MSYKDKIINKLLSAKFLIAVMFSAAFCILALKGEVSGEAFVGIVSVVIGFYFKTETDTKKKITNEQDDNE